MRRDRQGCRRGDAPEVEVIYRALLVAHVHVEGKEVDGGARGAAEDFVEGGEAIATLAAVDAELVIASVEAAGRHWRSWWWKTLSSAGDVYEGVRMLVCRVLLKTCC